jgi:SIT4-associating protein SAP185/190
MTDSLRSRPKTPRLALMGHVILIAEEVCKFLERCPPELLSTIEGSFVQSEWQAFIDGPFSEAKMRDNQPLAGGKPMQPVPSAADTSKSDSDDDEDVSEAAAKIGEPLTRTSASEPFSRGFGFGSPHDDDDSGSDNEQGVVCVRCRLWTG